MIFLVCIIEVVAAFAKYANTTNDEKPGPFQRGTGLRSFLGIKPELEKESQHAYHSRSTQQNQSVFHA